MKRFVFIIFLTFLGSFLAAQNVGKFNKVYSILSGYGSEAIGVSVATNGYIIYGGTVYAPNKQAVAIMKIDSIGNSVWAKYFPDGSYNFFWANTSNELGINVPWGGEIVAGILQNNSTGFDNWGLYRFDSKGDTVWTRNYKDSTNFWANQIKITRDNKYLIYGSWVHNYTVKVALIKTDSLGNKIWQKTYGGFSTCLEAMGVDTCKDGGFILVAYQFDSLYYCSGSIFVIKTDSLGNVQWEKTINSGSPCEAEPAGVLALQHGGYAVCGFYDDHQSNEIEDSSVLYMIKLSSLGDTVWSRKYTAATMAWEASKVLCSIRELSNGDLVSCGNGGDNTIVGCILKVDSDGNQKWVRYYTNPSTSPSSDFYFTDIRLTNDGGFISSGIAYGDTTKIWVVKTDSLGCDDTTDCLFTGVNEIKQTAMEVKVYPNPSSGSFILSLSNINTACNVDIYNMLGEKIHQITTSSEITQISLGGQSQGIYLYRIISENGNLIGEGKLVVGK